jgi:SAM-dependent methyltransferase
VRGHAVRGHAVRRQLVRIANRARVEWRSRVRYAGDAVECPCCGGRFGRFMPRGGRAGVACPRCGALERHRLLWVWLRDNVALGDDVRDVLHVAPEPGLRRALRAVSGVRWVGGDLAPEDPGVEALDLTGLPFGDGSFDLVLCSHVLEHVADDGAALREIRRVLRPRGRAVLQQPVDESLERTREDPSASPGERLRRFGQEDHVRLYGRDFADRLRAAGLHVELVRQPAGDDPLRPADIYVCRS